MDEGDTKLNWEKEIQQWDEWHGNTFRCIAALKLHQKSDTELTITTTIDRAIGTLESASNWTATFDEDVDLPLFVETLIAVRRQIVQVIAPFDRIQDGSLPLLKPLLIIEEYLIAFEISADSVKAFLYDIFEGLFSGLVWYFQWAMLIVGILIFLVWALCCRQKRPSKKPEAKRS